MASNNNDSTTRFRVDISELRSQFTAAQRVVRLANSEFQAATAGMDDWANSANGLSAKINQLNSVLNAEEDKLKILQRQYELTRNELGENSREAQELQIKLNRQQATVTQVRNELTQYQTRLSELSSQTRDTRTAFERLSDTVAEQEKDLQTLQRGLANAVLEFGEGSQEAQQFRDSIATLTTDLNQNRQKLDAANQSVQDYTRGLSGINDQSNNAGNALDRLTSEIARQENDLQNLRREYQNTVLEQGESSQAAQQLGQRISDLSNDLNDNRTRLQDAADSTNQFDNSLQDVQSETENVSGGFTVLKGALANLISEGINKAIDAFKDLMVSSDKALNSLQAKTGMTTEEMSKFKGEMEDLYKQNYGESMEDLADAMATVAQNSKDTDPSKIKELTKNAIILRDTFGFEVNESMRAANMLIDQFGVTGDEAFNLIAQGAQNGLDKNGDLLDSINEYGVHYKQMGYSAEEFFNSLKNGTDAGTFSVDKLGDAMKEFGIRVKDGSESTNDAFKSLTIVSDIASESLGTHREALSKLEPELEKLESELRYAEMAQAGFNEKTSEMTRTKNTEKIASLREEIATVKDKIDFNKVAVEEWENSNYNTMKSAHDLAAMFSAGGDEAQQATNEVLTALFNMDDAVKQNEVGVALFGTMWEDLGVDGVKALMDVNGEADKTAETMKQINEVKYDDIGSAFSEVGRTLETDLLLPIVNEVMPTIKGFIGWLKDEAIPWIVEHGTEIKAVVAGIGAAFVAFKAVTIIQGIITAFTTLIPIIKSVGVAQAALNLVMSANPVGLIVAAIAGLVAAFVTLWNKSDKFREFWINLWEKIKEITSVVIGALKTFFTNLWEDIKVIFSVVTTWFSQKFTEAKNGIITAFTAVKTFFSNIWEGIKKVFASIGNWFSDKFNSAKEGIANVFTPVLEFFGTIKDGIIEIFSPIVEFYIRIYTAIWEAIKDIWNNIIGFLEGCWELIQLIFKPVAEWFKKQFTKAWENIKKAWSTVSKWFSNLWDAIKKVFSVVANWFKEQFTKAWTNIKEAWSSVKTWFSNIWSGIKDIFSVVGTWFKDQFTNAWDNIKDAFSRVGSFFSDVWEAVKKPFKTVADWFHDTFSKAWQKVKDVFSTGGKIFDGIKDGIADTFKTVVNGIIGGINRVIEVPFNAINGALRKIRDISIAGVEPFKDKLNEIDVPQIPLLAKGGIVKGATTAIIGEDGAEAVVPLEKNTRWMDLLADKIVAKTGSNNINNSTKIVNNNFYQTNNSPKALSRLDVYRQSKNLLAMKGG